MSERAAGGDVGTPGGGARAGRAAPGSPESAGLDAAVSLSAAWQRTYESLVRGVLHDLGNALAAFRAFADMVRMGESFETALLPMYEEELEKLEELLRAAWLLPRRSEPRPEPISLASLLPRLLALQARHRELGQVPCAAGEISGVSPVSMDTALACQAVLVLLATAAAAVGVPGVEEREAAGSRSGVTVALLEEEGSVTLRVERPGAATAPPPDLADGLEAVRRTVESAGGRLRESAAAGRVRFELALPALV